MSGVDALRGQIAAAQKALEEKTSLTTQLDEDINEATERQRLRRELERIQTAISDRESKNNRKRNVRAYIDDDLVGDFAPQKSEQATPWAQKDSSCLRVRAAGHVMNYSEAVVKGDYVWKIEGLSWLLSTLKQRGDDHSESDEFSVGGEPFVLRYHPSGGQIGTSPDDEGQFGSLAIIHQDVHGFGITFRHKLMIKRADGEFVQWGETGDVCLPDEDTEGTAFGPDVHTASRANLAFCPPSKDGVFGLSHKELLLSEWVVSDALTVKAEMEVRRDKRCGDATLQNVEVPEATLGSDMLALLEEGISSDVTFIIEGEHIKAHSAILCARSEVFKIQLNSGMRESVSKEIVVEDCDPAAFKGLIRFLYSDDANIMDSMIKGGDGSSSSSDTAAVVTSPETRMCLLQGVLAASHKYQVTRLRLWCERQLCERITINDVCSVLQQAHLYEAKHLEEACLKFVKEHFHAIVVMESFGIMSKDWPEVALKVNIFMAGVSENSAEAAIQAQRKPKSAEVTGTKRKRESVISS